MKRNTMLSLLVAGLMLASTGALFAEDMAKPVSTTPAAAAPAKAKPMKKKHTAKKKAAATGTTAMPATPAAPAGK